MIIQRYEPDVDGLLSNAPFQTAKYAGPLDMLKHFGSVCQMAFHGPASAAE